MRSKAFPLTNPNLRNVFLVLLLALFPLKLMGQQHLGHSENEHPRTHWVEEAKDMLKQLNPATIQESVKLASRLDEGMIYQKYLLHKPGLIRFDNGDWVYIMFNSGHDSEEVGDLTIARDQDGNLYYNLGHVCGELYFFARTQTICNSSEAFFAHFISKPDKLPWVALTDDDIPLPDHSHD